ncbi:SET domain-containing protein [Auriscalpium vulgare]|uniref:SET domain-containing protein n=1 Tax=Auriscalpium vulgare TaxID=40419 RepID=A0ACB8S2E1_9AGAM|nr:SET domain-containing protein [Auriscalpium vulgare]
MLDELETVNELRAWFASHGGHFNPKIRYTSVFSGLSIAALEDLPPDSTIVSCPIPLAITPSVAQQALAEILKNEVITADWNERQLISVYIAFHWIVDPQSYTSLAHLPYLNTLPAPSQLCTPLHFAAAELNALKGTNLYGATLDRRREWEAEWETCRTDLARANKAWAEELTWERYLTAATYLSSRAFPSTLLSRTPSLLVSKDSYPVLLPGIDSLNHARAQPVSWIVDYPSDSADGPEPTIALVSHAAIPAHSEIFNNYGPKPNSELILGYGFAIPDNPDDTIVLKIGGASSGSGKDWEVGREAKGIEGLWQEILDAVYSQPQGDDETLEDNADPPPEWSLILDAADMLNSMSSTLLSRLPEPSTEGNLRPDVALMIEQYVAGQRDILLAIIDFAGEKEAEGISSARREGHVLDEDLAEEDEDEEEEE